jgi:hypothetical protein
MDIFKKKNNLYIHYYIINYTYMDTSKIKIFTSVVNDSDTNINFTTTSKQSNNPDITTSNELNNPTIRVFYKETPQSEKPQPQEIEQTSSFPKLSFTKIMAAIYTAIATSSVTWAPLMVIGGKNKYKSKKINKII